jgi:hypothetical protein
MAKKSTNPDISKQSFISLFNSIASHKHRYSVFSDFVFMSGIALHNAIIKDEKLEKEYFEITARYSKEEEKKFAQLLAEFIRLLDDKPAIPAHLDITY